MKNTSSSRLGACAQEIGQFCMFWSTVYGVHRGTRHHERPERPWGMADPGAEIMAVHLTHERWLGRPGRQIELWIARSRLHRCRLSQCKHHWKALSLVEI